MNIENVSTLKIHKLTQAQYERERAAGNIDEYAMYLTPDEVYDLSDYETKDDAQAKLAEANTYADTVGESIKNDLLNGASEAYNTLKELGDLIDENVDAIDALETVAANKADKEHGHNVATQSESGFMSSADKVKLDGIAPDANAYTHPSYTARTGVPS